MSDEELNSIYQDANQQSFAAALRAVYMAGLQSGRRQYAAEIVSVALGDAQDLVDASKAE